MAVKKVKKNEFCTVHYRKTSAFGQMSVCIMILCLLFN